ncbi:hypothetical protein SAMN05216197_1335 [Pseudomonas graminis]|uniref:Uncharacterized protein n=1 Tax=Pseudomonas graminis TaxID=158627 RepID=A0A1I0I5C6_9PSED|nr:hypothetical protein SAMN05216197_1335 [Pseudomonas graminis]
MITSAEEFKQYIESESEEENAKAPMDLANTSPAGTD